MNYTTKISGDRILKIKYAVLNPAKFARCPIVHI